MSATFEDLKRQVSRLERRARREAEARQEAERLLESKSLELYQANQRLIAMNVDLERRVEIRTQDVERERRIAVEMAERDLLTGLASRVRFQSHLSAAVAASTRSSEQVALLLIDLDRFKQVNDRLGHAAGDALLVQVGERLRQVVRPTELVARLGGDEFAIVLSHPTRATEIAMDAAQRIAHALSRPCSIAGLPIQASCSIGIAAVPTHVCDEAGLLRYADLALYDAKANGRGRFAIFQSRMLSDFEDRHQLELDLVEAIATGAISAHFQPIVDTRSLRTVSAEILARWHHPTRGMVSPEQFIPIAEERGLIDVLGKHILKIGSQQAVPLIKAGLIERISVNVSPIQLQNPDLADEVCEIVDAAGLLPQHLLLEVTESVMLTGHQIVKQSLESLRNKGVRVALDDFGAGYSNLSYLSKLRVNLLKIDRGFVKDLSSRSLNASMIRSITDLAHELDLKVIIEGVETIDHLHIVQTLGCDLAQGFYFSKPLPISSFVDLLTGSARL